MGRKGTRKLIYQELIESFCACFIDQTHRLMDGYVGFIRHIGFMCGNAKNDCFDQAAQLKYDLVVQMRVVYDSSVTIIGVCCLMP